MPSVYESMTAQELHEIVTRLEAEGFVLPEGLTWFVDDGPRAEIGVPPRQDRYCLGNDDWAFDTPVPFAAAIIEVAARDWWLGTGDCVISTHSTGRTYTENFNVVGVLSKDITPLHAIAAAVEAAK